MCGTLSLTGSEPVLVDPMADRSPNESVCDRESADVESTTPPIMPSAFWGRGLRGFGRGLSARTDLCADEVGRQWQFNWT